LKDKTRYVTFYTKSGCRLCTDALDLLLDVSSEAACNLIIREIDILEDETLYARFRHRIPVFQFGLEDDGPTLYAPFTASDLHQALGLVSDGDSTIGHSGASGTELDAQGDLL